MKTRLLIILGILLSIEFTGITFAEELISLHNPYTDDERLRMASEKKIFAEKTVGGGSGLGIFDESNYVQSAVIIAILMGVGPALGFIYFWRKRK